MNRFERWLLWGSTTVVSLTGFVYAWMKYLMTPEGPYAVVNHPLQPWVLKAHIVTAPLLVFAVGLVFMRHIWEQWRSGLRRGRASGLFTFLTLVPMVLTGYLVQTVTHGGWLWWLAAIHLVTGTAYALGFAAHQGVIQARHVLARRRARRMKASRVTDRLEAAIPGPLPPIAGPPA